MKAAAIAILFALSTCATAPATAKTAHIVDDHGGQIGVYMLMYDAVRQSDDNVVIESDCLSACTLILGTVPLDRVCAMPNARLGFHAAWAPGQSGAPIIHAGATQFLLDVYPVKVRRWIAAHGGLTSKLIFMEGRDLAAVIHTCQ